MVGDIPISAETPPVDASNGCFDNGQSCNERLQRTHEPLPFVVETDIESVIEAQLKRVIRHASLGNESRGAWVIKGEFQDAYFFAFNKYAIILSQVIPMASNKLRLPNYTGFGTSDNGIESIQKGVRFPQ